MQLGGLYLGSNFLEGPLPDSWGGFANVSHCCNSIKLVVYIKQTCGYGHGSVSLQSVK